MPNVWFALLLCASLARSFTIQSTKRSVHLHHSSLPMFHKIFEESGPLGKGITVGKIQVALFCKDRSRNSIFGFLKDATDRSSSSSSASLAQLANDVCLQLLRKSDDWTAACSESKWFSQSDSAKAESYFNDLANREAVKFEKVSDSSKSRCGIEVLQVLPHH